MAKNFNNANTARAFEAAKKSSLKADVITVKMISNEDLLDYPHNHEDVTDTADLENSIKELGFTDPIEVTSFGQADGKYMIVSGHRRRTAGVKCGISAFPCIVKPFDSESQIANYVLLANSQRDSAKDALLFMKRYKLHEAYLENSGFSGNFRSEIAKRMGLSVQQADRYAALSQLIVPILDLVQQEEVGMSSVMPIAPHSVEEQQEIYEIMMVAHTNGISLTRATVKDIVSAYREGRKTWAAVREWISSQKNTSVKTPDFGFDNPRIVSDTPVVGASNRNDEVHREYDVISAEADRADEEQARWNALNTDSDSDSVEVLNDTESTNTGEKSSTSKTHDEPTAKEKNINNSANDIVKALNKLVGTLHEPYSFDSSDDASKMLEVMARTIRNIIYEMSSISDEFSLDKQHFILLDGIKSICRDFPNPEE